VVDRPKKQERVSPLLHPDSKMPRFTISVTNTSILEYKNANGGATSTFGLHSISFTITALVNSGVLQNALDSSKTDLLIKPSGTDAFDNKIESDGSGSTKGWKLNNSGDLVQLPGDLLIFYDAATSTWTLQIAGQDSASCSGYVEVTEEEPYVVGFADKTVDYKLFQFPTNVDVTLRTCVFVKSATPVTLSSVVANISLGSAQVKTSLSRVIVPVTGKSVKWKSVSSGIVTAIQAANSLTYKSFVEADTSFTTGDEINVYGNMKFKDVDNASTISANQVLLLIVTVYLYQ
jgi:hypothetical protein